MSCTSQQEHVKEYLEYRPYYITNVTNVFMKYLNRNQLTVGIPGHLHISA